MFHERADLLQPYIDRILPRPLSLHAPSDHLTLKQRLALDWAFAISSCLRRGMSYHARCRSCSILLGPGHFEPGLNGFCSTHSDIPLPPAPTAREAPVEVLAWLAAAGPHAVSMG